MVETKPIHVAWLSGNKRAREAHLEKIRKSFGEFEEMSLSAATLESLENAVISSDIFGNKRLVLINEIPQATGTRQQLVNELRKLMDRVPSDCLLIFNGIDPDDEKALSGHVAKIGKIWRFDDSLSSQQAAEWVIQRLSEMGKEIEGADAEALVQLQPSEDGRTFLIDQLGMVCDKLASYLDRKKKVEPQDIIALDCGDGHSDIWSVFEAIDANNFEKCCLLVQRLLLSQDANEFVFAFLPVAIWRYRMLACLKDAISDGKSVREAVNAVCELKKMKQEGVLGQMRFTAEGQAYNEWFINNKVLNPGVLKGYSRSRLNKIMECLDAYAEESRYCTDRQQYLLLVESFLMLACDQMDDSTRRKVSQYFAGCNET